jgi:hypothetical protein
MVAAAEAGAPRTTAAYRARGAAARPVQHRWALIVTHHESTNNNNTDSSNGPLKKDSKVLFGSILFNYSTTHIWFDLSL